MKRIHLGAGTNVVDGWDNLDIVDAPGIILQDLTQRLPYADSSVDSILSEHVIEHFTKEAGYRLLEECHRVLIPGGGFRVGWPDLTKLIRAYFFRSKRYRRFVTPYFDVPHLFGTWDETLSDCLFAWEHRYAYTKRQLAQTLQRVGFVSVTTKGFMQSDYGIQHDVRDDPATTYLEATKRSA